MCVECLKVSQPCSMLGALHMLQNCEGDINVLISGMYTKIGRLNSPFIAAHHRGAVQSRRATLSMMGNAYSGSARIVRAGQDELSVSAIRTMLRILDEEHSQSAIGLHLQHLP